ncbi:MAG: acetyl-CoA C-acyltransferase [Deinococcus-Thermus bacterium]|jgi:acetyl-CoA C-acetyltransferase|nr:acetyl-CoA C-acyltransferase [Deinococcota bacterium]
MAEVIVAGAARTPTGGFQGALAPVRAPDLAATAARAAVGQAEGALIDEVVMGCVLPAGLGQAPARQAGFAAGLGAEVPAVTLNKMCGSGMAAAMAAHDRIALGAARVVLAGGMESMTRAPYLLPNERGGARIGHGEVIDSMFRDGLEDAYERGPNGEPRLMGTFAEDCAEAFQFTREAQDSYALASLSRARDAQASGAFAAEIAPVAVAGRKGETVVADDEQPQTADPGKIPTLRPAFRAGGTVTAANSSSISDGAAALVLAAADTGLAPRAFVRGHATHAQAPALFPTAPVPAARKLLDRVGWAAADVDLWEVNEAFAVVPMAFMRELGVPHERMNLRGGACALGHPIGASGARILVTLLHAMEAEDVKRGVAAICIGGGEGMAVALERP